MRIKLIIFLIPFLLFNCSKVEEKKEDKKNVIEKKVEKVEISKFKKHFKNKLGMDFVFIKPGTFNMGPLNEPSMVGGMRTDTHKVTLTKGFYMQTTETTIDTFKCFVAETKYKTQAEKDKRQNIYYISYDSPEPSGDGFREKDHSWKKPGYKITDKHPVTLVSWEDSKNFIKWLNRKETGKYRLPTEAEWEYACRAGTTTNFSNGNLKYTVLSKDGEKPDPTLDKIGWYFNNCGNGAHPVGLKEPNPWGLYDIHGNVLEFCEDNFVYEFTNEHAIDPLFKSKEKGAKVVGRGGGWWYNAFLCTSSARDLIKIKYCDNILGFRVVKDVEPTDLKDDFKGQPIIWKKPKQKNAKAVAEKTEKN